MRVEMAAGFRILVSIASLMCLGCPDKGAHPPSSSNLSGEGVAEPEAPSQPAADETPIVLPRSTSDVTRWGGAHSIQVKISQDQVVVGSEWFPVDDRTTTNAPLERAFKKRLEPLKAEARRVDAEPTATLLIHADAEVHAGRVLTVIVNAYRAGITDFALAVDPTTPDAGSLVIVYTPGEWMRWQPREEVPPSTAPVVDMARNFNPEGSQPMVTIDDMGIQVREALEDSKALTKAPQPVEWTTTRIPFDLARLEAWAKRVAREGPETGVRVMVAHELSVQELVSALDALRGPQCRLDDALRGGGVPKDCYLYQPSLDARPTMTRAQVIPGIE